MLSRSFAMLLACSSWSTISSFAPCSSLAPTARENARQRPTCVMSQPLADANTAKGLNSIERSSVQRFTIAYDKLCNSCPTRLRPRVDTLTEMIVGLPVEERRELMQAVARRLEGGEESMNGGAPHRRVQTPRDVYDYQIAGASAPEVKEKMQGTRRISDDTVAGTAGAAIVDGVVEEIDVVDAKRLRKLKKIRAKFDSNKRRLARARRLLAVTNALLSKNGSRAEPTIYTVANPVDNGWYHDVDELKTRSRGELKMEKLKLTAQKAKYESKVAKGRLKLYKASVDLMDHAK